MASLNKRQFGRSRYPVVETKTDSGERIYTAMDPVNSSHQRWAAQDQQFSNAMEGLEYDYEDSLASEDGFAEDIQDRMDEVEYAQFQHRKRGTSPYAVASVHYKPYSAQPVDFDLDTPPTDPKTGQMSMFRETPAQITNLAVHPEHRGKGLSSRLLNYATEAAYADPSNPAQPGDVPPIDSELSANSRDLAAHHLGDAPKHNLWTSDKESMDRFSHRVLTSPPVQFQGLSYEQLIGAASRNRSINVGAPEGLLITGMDPSFGVGKEIGMAPKPKTSFRRKMRDIEGVQTRQRVESNVAQQRLSPRRTRLNQQRAGMMQLPGMEDPQLP